ncbi:gamma-glutamylcyclotransferase [Myxococcota bacterium]|nr:gamma-glutamylcyclotransferase [Myxococcota bacterium]
MSTERCSRAWGCTTNSGGARFLGPAVTHGRLYDIGRFPGLCPGEELVVGEIYEINADILGNLDLIEGFDGQDPAGSHYCRRRVPVTRLGDAAGFEAWSYFYNRDLQGLVPIPHGDYRRYILESSDDRKVLVSYGSNMHSERRNARVGATPQSHAGTLPGYRLVFNKKPLVCCGAFANLLWAGAGHAAPFVATEVTDGQLAVLDDREGVPNHYLRTTCLVSGLPGTTSRICHVYLANPSQVIPETRPQEDYVGHIRAGYRENGFEPAF